MGCMPGIGLGRLDRHEMNGTHLTCSTRTAARVLGAITLMLTALSVAGQLARFSFLHGRVTWWVALFDVNREQNIPTYWQGMSIFITAILLGVIAWHACINRERFRWAWITLSAGFVLLSMDETCTLHEQFELLMQSGGRSFSGAFRYSWVIPGLLIVAIVGACYVRFLLHLPRATRIRFIVAGAIYVSGAIGMEMVGGWYDDRFGANNLTCQMLANLEELMEMAGMSMFIVFLIEYIAEHVGVCRFEAVASTRQSPADRLAAPHRMPLIPLFRRSA